MTRHAPLLTQGKIYVLRLMGKLPLLLGLGVTSAFSRLEATQDILFGDAAGDVELRYDAHEFIVVGRLLLGEELVHGHDIFQEIVEGIKGVVWLHGNSLPEWSAPMQI